MLLELEKVKPDTIEIEKMMHIPQSEYHDLKNALSSIKVSQSISPARQWLTEKTILDLETALNLKGGTEGTVRIALDEIKTNKTFAEKGRQLRQENIELKKRLAELQPAP